MAELKYKSNRTVFSSCKYHVVFCPKYRRKVLVEPRDNRLRGIINQVYQECQSEILSQEIVPDHVHLLVECDPQFGIHQPVRMLKGRSSHLLRQEFPALKSKLPTRLSEFLFCLNCS